MKMKLKQEPFYYENYLPNTVHWKNGFLSHRVFTHIGDNGVSNDHCGVSSEPDDNLRESHERNDFGISA